jgi:hypothetical protein
MFTALTLIGIFILNALLWRYYYWNMADNKQWDGADYTMLHVGLLFAPIGLIFVLLFIVGKFVLMPPKPKAEKPSSEGLNDL